MTKHMTPDPREEKLPVWVQSSVASMRSTIQDLEAALTTMQGEHQESNVRILKTTSLGNIPLPKNSMVKFDNKWGEILVCHERDGRIRIQGDKAVVLRMLAGNALTVELEDA